jgi:hypothetical protein
MPFNLYPRLRASVLQLQRSSEDPQQIAQAIKTWDAADLEAAGSERGIVMPMLRSVEEFMQEPQYVDHLAHLPLIEIEKIGDSIPSRRPNARSPLDGVRFGLARVIAWRRDRQGDGVPRRRRPEHLRPDDFEIEMMPPRTWAWACPARCDRLGSAGWTLMRDADVFTPTADMAS